MDQQVSNRHTGLMRTIREVAGSELVWVSAGTETFELRAGDEVVGRLQWKGSSLAVGETADQQWTFNRKGIWRPSVTVRVPGSDDNIALFHPGWMSGGTLELGPGRQLRLGPSGFWSGPWDWTDELKRPLVRFRSKRFLKWKCAVEIEKEADPGDAPLLVELGWYLIVMHWYDAQAGGGA